MYLQSDSIVKPPSVNNPDFIVLMNGGEAVCVPASDVAGTHAGVYLYIADMVTLGWTALRIGDAIVMHPLRSVVVPMHLRWFA